MPLDFDIVQTERVSDNGLKAIHNAERSMRIEVVRDVDRFSSLHDEWNSIAEKGAATVFQTHEWLFLWWKHFGTEGYRFLHILLFRDQQTIVGIIPLFLEVHTTLGFLVHKRLRLLGCGVASTYSSYSAISEYGPSDFLDFIALPESRSHVAEAFINYLKDNPFVCDEIKFENASDESIIKKELFPWLEATSIHYEIHVRRSDICPRLNIPSTIEEYLRGLHSSVRRRLRQAQNTFSRDGNYALETISSGKLSDGFQDLVDLHQSRWNRLGYPGLFQDYRFEDFQRDILKAFWEHGWVWFKAVQLDGSRVAIRLGFKFNRRLYDYLSGFDDRKQVSKYRPGLALLFSMLEDAVQWGYQYVEFLRGKEEYKFELTSDVMNNWTIRLLNRNTYHSFRSHLYQAGQWFTNIIFQLSKERELLHVQFEEHGFLSGLLHYVSFRANKFIDKVFSWLKKTSDEQNRTNHQQVYSEREP
jgi:CelD/BcsL family acetyltransferase involved in cellulose biosynthesis